MYEKETWLASSTTVKKPILCSLLHNINTRYLFPPIKCSAYLTWPRLENKTISVPASQPTYGVAHTLVLLQTVICRQHSELSRVAWRGGGEIVLPSPLTRWSPGMVAPKESWYVGVRPYSPDLAPVPCAIFPGLFPGDREMRRKWEKKGAVREGYRLSAEEYEAYTCKC